jgi:hypothetical protein
MQRHFYSNTISGFLKAEENFILGTLANNNSFDLTPTQRDSWKKQIEILQTGLTSLDGSIFIEYSIPRLGKRIDVVLLIGPVIFVLEFKVGEAQFHAHDLDQVWDYALDLNNFHETSSEQFIAPIVVATEAKCQLATVTTTQQHVKLLHPIKCNSSLLRATIDAVLLFSDGERIISHEWEQGRYCPTPTIIEAAMALYSGHSVTEISRSDATATNLSLTSESLAQIIRDSKQNSRKSICFVTGVPGAGKTLVGLNVATKHFDKNNDLYSVFLSGNGPLVAILREALARDKVTQEKQKGKKLSKKVARSEVQLFIQNVHHFRDECLLDEAKPPVEHVAIFDEAQRAWNLQQTANFMKRKKKRPDFQMSEPEFLISCLDRHPDWGVVICLVGGGQEINTGEAGISEWIESIARSFKDWYVYISPKLIDTEYGSGETLQLLEKRPNVSYHEELHLAVSMRSFRTEHVSNLVKQVLDLESDHAREILQKVRSRYPIAITRDLVAAKQWLRDKASGSERYGLVVSSEAQRLKPYAIDVKSPMDPIHWFLDGKGDVRSSYFLEDVATEFHVQGLELDWACVTWDADFRYSSKGWQHWSFVGDRWNKIKKFERQRFLKNAYRVLLTRARQGMVIVVPEGNSEDHTRKHEYYDTTFEYLRSIGFDVI